MIITSRSKYLKILPENDQIETYIDSSNKTLKNEPTDGAAVLLPHKLAYQSFTMQVQQSGFFYDLGDKITNAIYNAYFGKF